MLIYRRRNVASRREELLGGPDLSTLGLLHILTKLHEHLDSLFNHSQANMFVDLEATQNLIVHQPFIS